MFHSAILEYNPFDSCLHELCGCSYFNICNIDNLVIRDDVLSATKLKHCELYRIR